MKARTHFDGRLNIIAAAVMSLALCSASAWAAEEQGRHDHRHEHGHNHVAQAAPAPPAPVSANQLSKDPRLQLPPLPAGVQDLSFSDFFKPIGPRGLEYTDKIKALEGKHVRILGYMVQQETPVPGMCILSPIPVQCHESEMGLADDLPATLVHVFAATNFLSQVPYTPGVLLLTGTLSLGAREESDGRISTVRLKLDLPPGRHAAIPTSEAGGAGANAEPDLTNATSTDKANAALVTPQTK